MLGLALAFGTAHAAFAGPPVSTQTGPNFVVNNIADDGDGACDVAGTGDGCTLREAIDAANTLIGSSTTNISIAITFDADAFAGLQVIELTQGDLPPLNGDISISGPTAPGTLVAIGANNNINTTNPDTVFQINGGNVKLSDLNIIGERVGVSISGGAATVQNCSFFGNDFGVNQTGGTLTVSNSTFGFNSAAAISSSTGSGTATVTNSTVTQNSAGIVVAQGANTVTVSNSIVSGNDSDATGITDGGFNFIGGDAKLGDFSFYGGSTLTFEPAPDSPVINAGDPKFDGTGLFDQRGDGFARVVGGRLDIGAFEVQNNAPTVSDFSLALTEDTSFTFAKNSFDAAFSDVNAGDTLQAVRIVTLPANGTLNLNGVAVAADDEIARADLPQLTFAPDSNFNGAITFSFNASDGQLFANADATATLDVAAVNDAPSFVVGSDQNVNQNSGAQKVQSFIPKFSAGPANEAGQKLSFIVTTDNNALFSVQPAINSNGALTYTLAPKASGTAKVSVTLKDDGGMENGGQNTSEAQSFNINVANTAIKFSVSLTPRPAFTNDTLTATPSNAGSTDVQFFYEYFVNGTRVQRGSRGTGNTLNLRSKGFGDKGDVVAVRVTATNPSNGGTGQAVSSVRLSNSAPVAVGGTASAKSGVETLIPLTLKGAPGASDIDGDRFIYRRAGKPANGTAEFESSSNGSGVLHYTSRPGFVGTEDVKFYAVDSDNAYSNVGTIRITVTANGSASASAIQSGSAPSGGAS